MELSTSEAWRVDPALEKRKVERLKYCMGMHDETWARYCAQAMYSTSAGSALSTAIQNQMPPPISPEIT